MVTQSDCRGGRARTRERAANNGDYELIARAAAARLKSFCAVCSRSRRPMAVSRFMAGAGAVPGSWPARGGPARPVGAGARFRPTVRVRCGSLVVRRRRRAACAAGVRRAVHPTTRGGRRRRGARRRGCCAGPPSRAQIGQTELNRAAGRAQTTPRERVSRAQRSVVKDRSGPLLARAVLSRAGFDEEGVLVVDVGECAERSRGRPNSWMPCPRSGLSQGLVSGRGERSRTAYWVPALRTSRPR